MTQKRTAPRAARPAPPEPDPPTPPPPGSIAAHLQDPGIVLVPDDQAQLSESLLSIFTEAMEALDVPEDNEELANQIMQTELLGLLDRAFVAGASFAVNRLLPDQPVSVSVTSDEAIELVRGLVSGRGLELRLVVEEKTS